jgi:hypothetical protein
MRRIPLSSASQPSSGLKLRSLEATHFFLTFPASEASLLVGPSMASCPGSPLWEREPRMKNTESSPGVLPMCVAGYPKKECRRKELRSAPSSPPTSSPQAPPMKLSLINLHRRPLKKSPRKRGQIGLEFMREKPEECKDYTLQLRLLQGLQPVARRICLRRWRSRASESKSHRGKNTKTGGSDPTFGRSIRPKCRGVTPARHAGSVMAAALQIETKSRIQGL